MILVIFDPDNALGQTLQARHTGATPGAVGRWSTVLSGLLRGSYLLTGTGVPVPHWGAAFLARRAEILRLGFDEKFMHVWEFYLAYCEAAFDMANIDLVQYTLAKPAA